MHNRKLHNYQFAGKSYM